MADSENGSYEFIIQNSDESLSKETRTKIRRQAMKAIGIARRKPVFSTNPSFETVPGFPAWLDPSSLHPFPPMPLSGLELLVKDRGLDPMDLSALTSIHLGTV